MSKDVKFLGEVSAVGRIHSDTQIDVPVVNASDTISATTLQATADVKINGASVRGAISELSTNKADKATTLEGYGIEDAYTKEETLNLLKEKPDKATTLQGYNIQDAYTKTDTDALHAETKSGAISESKSYTDGIYSTLDNKKADKATTLEGYGITDAYTIQQANSKNAEDVASAVQASKSYTDQRFLELGESGFSAVQSDWNAPEMNEDNSLNYAHIKNKPDCLTTKSIEEASENAILRIVNKIPTWVATPWAEDQEV